MLAPRSQKKFLSWFTGWLTFAGWTGNAAATALFFGQLVLAIVQINHADFNPDSYTSRWQSTLIGIGALALACFFNTVLSRWLPSLGKILIFYQIAVILGIVVPMVVKSDHNTASDVFTHFVKNAGWTTNGMAFMIGLSSSNVALIGVDVPTHFGTSRNCIIASQH